MLVGSFDERGRSRIRATVRIPGLRFRRDIAFLIDTGSSTTALNVDDLSGLDLTPLGRGVAVGRGYGGPLVGHEVLGLVHFVEGDTGTHGYQVSMLLFDDATSVGLPSVLGRDVLDRGRLTCDPTNGILDFEIWRSDDFVPR